MDYSARVKGSITQSLLKSLLADAGYRVVPLGVEEVVREVSNLDNNAYAALDLPNVLRRMPDFFVADRELSKTWLVEVKFRKEWNEDVHKVLGKQLRDQVKHWKPIYLIIFLGTPAKIIEGYPSAWIGVAKLTYADDEIYVTSECGKEEKKWDDISWPYFSRIQKVFSKLDTKEKWNGNTLKKTWSSLHKLMDILDT